MTVIIYTIIHIIVLLIVLAAVWSWIKALISRDTNRIKSESINVLILAVIYVAVEWYGGAPARLLKAWTSPTIFNHDRDKSFLLFFALVYGIFLLVRFATNLVRAIRQKNWKSARKRGLYLAVTAIVYLYIVHITDFPWLMHMMHFN